MSSRTRIARSTPSGCEAGTMDYCPDSHRSPVGGRCTSPSAREPASPGAPDWKSYSFDGSGASQNCGSGEGIVDVAVEETGVREVGEGAGLHGRLGRARGGVVREDLRFRRDGDVVRSAADAEVGGSG